MKAAILFAAALIFFAGEHSAVPPSAADQQARVRAHLEGVLEELRAAQPAGLDAAQRAARAETLEWLAEYTARGVYPHNHVTAETSPIFVDPHGTPCAVGYLLLRSGESDLVAGIVRANNRVRVPELAGDARLEDWLNRRGLTLDEAARIQPVYDGGPSRAPADQPVSTYSKVSVAVSALNVGTTAYSVTAAESVRRAGWAEPVAVANLIGHTSLLVTDLLTDDKPGWAPWVHGLGLLVGTFHLAWLTEPTDSPADEDSIQWTPILAPDRVGLRVTW